MDHNIESDATPTDARSYNNHITSHDVYHENAEVVNPNSSLTQDNISAFRGAANFIPETHDNLGDMPSTNKGLVIKDSSYVHIGNNFTFNSFGKNKNSKKKQKKSAINIPASIYENSGAISLEQKKIVCKHLGKKWRRLGRELGFSDGCLDTFQQDHYASGQYEVAYQMIRTWSEENCKENRTIGKLAHALYEADAMETLSCLATSIVPC